MVLWALIWLKPPKLFGKPTNLRWADGCLDRHWSRPLEPVDTVALFRHASSVSEVKSWNSRGNKTSQFPSISAPYLFREYGDIGNPWDSCRLVGSPAGTEATGWHAEGNYVILPLTTWLHDFKCISEIQHKALEAVLSGYVPLSSNSCSVNNFVKWFQIQTFEILEYYLPIYVNIF